MSKVAGGQITTSAVPAPPAATASQIAAASARLLRKPFIFQLPATRERDPWVMQKVSGYFA
jgi:hypothetical protein